jgi:hypothetical protein
MDEYPQKFLGTFARFARAHGCYRETCSVTAVARDHHRAASEKKIKLHI